MVATKTDISSSVSSSDCSSEDIDNIPPMEGRDIFVRCIQLPEFILTHAEYSKISVPQMKNFKVIKEKKSRSKRVRTREFFQNLDEREKSRGYCIVISVVSVLIFVAILLTILYAAVFE